MTERGLRRAADWTVAIIATPDAVLIGRAYVSRDPGSPGLAPAFLLLATAAGAIGAAHRHALGWAGVTGCGLMAAGAAFAATAVGGYGSLASEDSLWQAHFVIMLGSLLVAAGATRSGALSRPTAIVAFVASWAFLGAWGLGLAWVAWTLALRRPPHEGDPRRDSASISVCVE